MTRLPSRVGLLSAGVLLLLGTSACGELHPGQAVSVGSQSLSQTDADETTRDVCLALGVLTPQGEAQSYANSVLQTSVAQSWLQRAMAEQLADEYEITPGASYDQAVTSARAQLAALDDDVVERVLPVYTATPYFVDVLSQIGRRTLQSQGTAAPSDQAALDSGIATAQDWAKGHPIETSPRLPDLTLGDDAFTVTPDESSVAVSAFARQAAAAQPAADYVDSLPASQVCG